MLQTDSHIKSNILQIQEALRTLRFGRAIQYFDEIPSTNTAAMQWATEGADEGSVVVADFQTAGRGRHGRSWIAQPARNLLFSTVLRPTIPVSDWGLITIIAGLAVSEAIEDFISPLTTRIKWPNDILIQGKKCCGMLLESVLTPQGSSMTGPAILGIGINVNEDTFDTDIAERTTSILLESGQHVPRLALLGSVLNRFEVYYDQLLRLDHAPLINAYTNKMAYINEKTTLRFTGKSEVIEGIIEGISPKGALCFKSDSGTQTFHSGEVTTQLIP